MPALSTEARHLPEAAPRPNARVHAERMLARAAEVTDARDAADLLVRAAELFENEEFDAAAAFGALAAALRRDPAHPEAPAALERVAGAIDSYPGALEVLGTAIQALKGRERGGSRGLAERGAEGPQNDASRRLWVRVATIALVRHPMPELAREAIQRAAEHGADAPDTLAVRAAWELHGGRFRDAAETLRRQACAEPDPRARLEVLLAQARLCEGELRDPARAIEAYTAALAIEPTHPGVLAALETLSATTHDWDRHLAVLDSRLALAQDAGERIALYRRMAAVWERKKGDHARAARCFEAILARDELDADALAELERLHRDGGRWPELVEALRRRVSVASDGALRLRLWKTIADVLEQRLGRPEEAKAALAEAIALAPSDRDALKAIARVEEALEDRTGAARAVSRLARLTPDAPAHVKVRLHEKAALLHGERESDTGRKRAERHLHEALALDPGHVSSARELARLYREAKQWARARKVLLDCVAHVGSALDQASLLASAAQLTEDTGRKQGNLSPSEARDEALSLWNRVLELDPEHLGAARAIVELELAAGRPADGEACAELLARHAADPTSALGTDDRIAALALSGRVALKLGHRARARARFAEVERLAPDHLATLIAQGELAFVEGRPAEAEQRWLKVLERQTRLRVHKRVLAATLCLVARAKQARGDVTGATACAIQALGEDDGHEPALELVAELGEDGGDREAAMRARQALAARAQGTARLGHLCALADAHMRGRDAQRAVVVLAEAVKLRPRDPELLKRALEACELAGRHREVISITLRLVELLEEVPSRAELHVRAARIARDHLAAPGESIGYFNLALDDLAATGNRARLTEVADELLALCIKAGDWTLVERNLRKLIRRLPQNDVLNARLYRALGDVYRDRLDRADHAAEAYRRAGALEPDGPARGELAALLEEATPRTPQAAAAAVRQRFGMLVADGYEPSHYHALYRLYRDSGQRDKAWCLARALVFFRRADVEQRELVASHKAENVVSEGAFDDEVWRRVRADGEDPAVSSVTSAIREAVLRTQAVPRDRLEHRGEEGLGARAELVRRAFARTSRILGVPMPELCYRPDDAGGLRLVPLLDRPRAPLGIAFVLGRDWLARYRSSAELEGAAAQALALLRPEHTLRRALATRGDLRTAILAALTLARPGTPVPLTSQAAVSAYIPRLAAALGPAARADLEQAAAHLDPSATLDPETWCLAVDASARRVALITTGDLELAARGVAAEGPRAGGPRPADLIRDLVVFAVSEPYFEIRRRLGTTVG